MQGKDQKKFINRSHQGTEDKGSQEEGTSNQGFGEGLE